MSLDLPPSDREQMEARLTALLLGELTAEEVEATRAALAQDPELARLHERLAQTIQRVSEAPDSLEEIACKPAPILRLSDERRDALMRSFKVIQPVQPVRLGARRTFRERLEWLDWSSAAGVAAVLIGLLGFGGEALFRSGDGESRDRFSSRMSVALDRSGQLANAPSKFAASRELEQNVEERSKFEASWSRTNYGNSPPLSGETPVAQDYKQVEERYWALKSAANSSSIRKEENWAQVQLTQPSPDQPPRVEIRTFGLGLEKQHLVDAKKSTTLFFDRSDHLNEDLVTEKSMTLSDEALASLNNRPASLTAAEVAPPVRRFVLPNLEAKERDKAPSKNALMDLATTITPNSDEGRSLARQRGLGEARISGKVAQLGDKTTDVDALGRKSATPAPAPLPEIVALDKLFSTFSLNVSDVSFKLAAASLEKGQRPDPATVRAEEFINAFDYRDPAPAAGAPIAFAWERARHPFEHDRELVRLSVKTAAAGRPSGQALNLVLLLDTSGSMERADRVRIRQECLRVLAAQLRPEDRVSVVSFARTARLRVDGLSGQQASELPERLAGLIPEGGTNLEEALALAYQSAKRHFIPQGLNRVVLLTDGAANLGDVAPDSLRRQVETARKQGIALDCFGIGWDGLNDELLEALSRNGDGRYGFVNTPEAASTEFAGQLAGALKVAASDVKVQIEWNPRRVFVYRQIGYAKHQLTREQFRDNTVDAAEIGAAEAGNALYTVQLQPKGEGPLGTVRVRFKTPGTSEYQEHSWPLAYDGRTKALDQSSPALRLAAAAAAFSEWLSSSPFAAEVTPDKLLTLLKGVPETWPLDPRPKQLEQMLGQSRTFSTR